MKISINTILNNAARLEVHSGRDFVVVKGLAVHGDSSMNGILYKTNVVAKKAKSLEGKPAPLSHPKRDGMHVSADDFFSKGAHDVAGKVMISNMDGDKNIATIYVDKEFAERSTGGKELVRRLLNGEDVGLSTGLVPTKMKKESGVDKFGVSYNEVVEDFDYDHLAFLIDETPAGVAAGTKIIYNSETGDSLEVFTHDEGSQSTSKPKVNVMEHKIDLADLSKADRAKVMACNAQDILAALTATRPEVTIDEAQTLLESKGMKVNSADSVVLSKADHEALKVNADLFLANEQERVDEIKLSIKTNSKMEDKDLEGMSEMALTRLANSLTPENDFSINDGLTTNAGKSIRIQTTGRYVIWLLM